MADPKDLMARFCDGDEVAFRELYRIVAPGILAYLAGMVSPDAFAVDLLQQTFITLLRARATYVRGADPIPWIYAIAHRTFLDHQHVGTPHSAMDDGWPLDHERIVRAWAPDERAALELCARGDLMTVAFDAVVRANGFSRRLTRVSVPAIPSRTLYVLHRRAVGRHRRTDALVGAIRSAAQQP